MKIKILIFWAIGGLFLFTSCEKFLEEKPYSFLSPENFYQNEKDAEAALVGVYASLGNGGTYYGYRKQRIGWWCSDVGGTNTNSATENELIDWRNTANHPEPREVWQNSYSTINQANAVIENVTLMDESIISVEKKNTILGEAHFLRALMYFDLVEIFGDIPLFLQETKSEEQAYAGTTGEEEIYNQIVTDLLFAIDNMTVYVRGTEEAIGRADKAAAKALLGKVYLNMAGFPLNQSSKAADGLAILKELIAEKEVYGLGLHDSYLDAFSVANENGKEDIFSIQFEKGYGAAHSGEGSLLHIQFGKGFKGRRGNWSLKVQPKLIFTFLNAEGTLDTLDQRYQQLTTSTTIDGTVMDHTPMPNYTNDLSVDYPVGGANFGKVKYRLIYKFIEQEIYDKNLPANDGDLNLPILRWAEVLLLAAECENEVNGPTSLAYQYLDEVRNRSNASLAPREMTKTQFADYILDERLRELYGEGQRYFDLKRTQKLLSEAQEAYDDYNGVFHWSKMYLPAEKNYYFPYPQTEIEANENLTQRSGF